MKKIKQLLNSTLLSNLLVNNEIILLESKSVEKSHMGSDSSTIKNFSKKSSKHAHISPLLDLLILQFPLNLITFSSLLDFCNYSLLKNSKHFKNVIVTKVTNHLFFKNRNVMGFFDSSKTFSTFRNFAILHVKLLRILALKMEGVI